jgi:hypothetical protein
MRADHDPFDRYRRDLPTVTTPLVTAYPTAGQSPGFKQVYESNIRNRLIGTAPLARKVAFRLVPLIYSAGPDGESAMVRPRDATVAPIDPYTNFEHEVTNEICQDGEIDTQNASATKDNITNHLIEY